MSVNNAGLLKGSTAITNSLPLFYNYRYDQLNRLKSMNVFNGLNTVNNSWQPLSIADYAETISYDANGNILMYNRKGSPSIAGKQLEMDDLSYNYIGGKNQLRQIVDNPAYVNNYTEDIDSQADPNNYTYDAIGNLKTDLSEGIENIEWTAYGKIASISKSSGGTDILINYTYDASGNRITKSVNNPVTGIRITIYVRDASGNVMSIYEKVGTAATEQIETHIYGSSRIGIANKLTVASSTVSLQGIYSTATIGTFTKEERKAMN